MTAELIRVSHWRLKKGAYVRISPHHPSNNRKSVGKLQDGNMRIFTAVFYLLFFNLTVFAQLQRPSHMCSTQPNIAAASYSAPRTVEYMHIVSVVAIASSLRVPVNLELTSGVGK